MIPGCIILHQQIYFTSLICTSIINYASPGRLFIRQCHISLTTAIETIAAIAITHGQNIAIDNNLTIFSNSAISINIYSTTIVSNAIKCLRHILRGINIYITISSNSREFIIISIFGAASSF